MPSAAAARFQERSEVLDFLLEVSTTISQTLDLDRLLANVSEIVQRVIPCELFAILLYSERQKALRVRYALGHREEVVRNTLLQLGEGLTGTAAQTRQPVLVGDVRNDPRYLATVDAVRTEMAVPMISRQKLVGVIDVQSTRLNAYGEYERALLSLIAGRVGSAIENARLYRRAERQNRTLKTLVAMAQEFSSVLDLDRLLTKISSSVRKLIEYNAFSILLVDEEQQALRHRFSIRYDQRVKLDNIPLGKGITGAAVESRAPVRVNDTSRDPRYIASHPGICSEVAVPLILNDKVIGVIDLESERLNFFTEDHQRMLSLLAPQIASSIENARLYEAVAVRERRIKQDLTAARELQFAMLRREPPRIEGLEVAVGLRPAREIGGDIYDFFEHETGHAMAAFGDVSGKGAAAALYGALITGLLRMLAPGQRNPAELMRVLNDAVVERKVEAKYATLTLMLWHPHSRQFTIANAGGLPPFVCRAGEEVKLRAEGIPVGLLPDRDYEAVTLQTQAGDLVVLFSDGITDHLSRTGEEFGRARLATVVRQNCARCPADIVSAIFQALDAFNLRAFDDQTLAVFKVL